MDVPCCCSGSELILSCTGVCTVLYGTVHRLECPCDPDLPRSRSCDPVAEQQVADSKDECNPCISSIEDFELGGMDSLFRSLHYSRR